MDNHNRKRHLSQFFTPEPVVRFMFDPSTGSGHRLAGFDPLWKVADPACGDGAFLKEALRRGASAVAFLRAQGHDAVHLRDQGLQRLEADEIVEKAVTEGRTDADGR